MSYLLKALQKAEAERKAQLDSAVAPTQSDVTSVALPKSLLVVALLILVLVVYSVFKPNADTEVLADVVTGGGESRQANRELDNGLIDAVRSDSEPNDSGPSNSEANAKSHAQMHIANDAELEKTINELPAQMLEPVELMALTAQQLAQLPSIRFQSHIFSSAAAYRSVVINDRTLNEGSLLAANIKVQEITPQGVVLDVHGTLVKLPKGQDWIAPAK